MVTSDMCMSDTTCFITSIGHGAPAMMPVLSDVRSKRLEIGMAEQRDEHGRHAVEAGASLAGHRLQRRAGVEALARETPWWRPC